MGRFNRAISKVTGVALMVALVVILAGLIGVLVLTGFDLKSTSSAGVTLDQGEVKVIEMGNSEKLLLKENGTTIGELNSTGDSIKVNGGEKIIAVTQNGNQNLLKTITKQQVRESGGKVYTEIPENLDSNNFSLSTDKYTGGEDRILQTTETYNIKFEQNYNPNSFTYNWGRNKDNAYWGNYENWNADITNNGKQATYEYTAQNYEGDTAAQVTITSKKNGDSVTFRTSRYNVEKPIQNVQFESNKYSSGKDRILTTTETLEVTNVNLHPKVSELPSASIPNDLSGYQWKGWGRNKDNAYWGNYENWNADITNNGKQATYEYTAQNYEGDTAAQVTLSVPGLDLQQSFRTSRYDVEKPIQNVQFESNKYSSGKDRILTTTETLEVTNITLHPKVSELPSASIPNDLSGYQWKGWGRNKDNAYWTNYENWNADITKNGKQATYEYTAQNYEGDTAAQVTLSVPGLDLQQSFRTSRYDVEKPIQNVQFESNKYSSSVDRTLGENETWTVTSVNLHPKVSELSSSSIPNDLSGYQWKGWGRNKDNAYWGNYENWNADITNNGKQATYEYTAQNYEGDTAAQVTLSVPGLDLQQSFRTYRYDVVD